MECRFKTAQFCYCGFVYLIVHLYSKRYIQLFFSQIGETGVGKMGVGKQGISQNSLYISWLEMPHAVMSTTESVV